MSGLVMYPKIMKEKTKQMLEQLKRLEPNAESAYKALGLVEENSYSLSGLAWDSVRTYMREVQQPLMQTYQLWLKYQTLATLDYLTATYRLPNVYCLDEDRLEADKQRYRDWIADEYEREHPRRYRIRHYKRMIFEINGKLAAMSIFVRTTRGIYDRAAELLAILGKADTMLKGVGMDPVTYEINYTSVDNEWLLEMKEKVSDDYLKKLGISAETIKRMNELGMSCIDLKATYESLQTEEEKKFFFGILNENYRTTFQIEPGKFYKETKFFLTKYTRLLLNKGKIDELQILINEMLYTDENHSLYDINEKASYSNAYVNILFETSSLILEIEGKMILDSKEILDEEEINILCKDVETMADLNVLFGTIRSTAFKREYFDASEIEIPEYVEYKVYGNRIVNLEYHEIGFKYNMIYSTVVVKDINLDAVGDNINAIEWHEDKPLEVSTMINTDADSIDAQKYRDTLIDIEKQKEELPKKYLLKIGTEIVGDLCPMAGYVYGTVTGIAEGNAGEINNQSYEFIEESGIIKPDVMKWYKTEGKFAVNMAAGIWDYFREIQRLDAQKKDEDTFAKLKWFGATSSFEAGASNSVETGRLTETVNAGYYNANAMKDLKDWEEKGLSSVIAKEIKDDKIIGKLIDNLKTQLNEEGKYTDEVKTLMEGGAILGMDMDKFDEAVKNIQFAYTNFYEGTDEEYRPLGKDLKIKDIFQ